MNSGFLSAVTFLIVACFVIILAYVTTLIVGKKANPLLNRRRVKVLEKTAIGLNTYITILEISRKIYILAVNSKGITLLDVVLAEEWHSMEQYQDKDEGGVLLSKDFPRMLKKYKKAITFPKIQRKSVGRNGSDEHDNFKKNAES